VVQVGCRVEGLYGKFEPGKGPFWSPSVDDLTTIPNRVVLRTMIAPEGPQTHPAWASLVPDRPFLFGSLMGGPDAYLALGSLGLPMALALMLQLIAPRGSREGFRARMGHSGQGSLVLLLGGFILASALLVGLLAGPWLSLPFAVGLMLAGLPGAWPTGLRWTSVALTALVLAGLGGGVVLGDLWARVPDTRIPFVPDTIQETSRVWSDALAIVADFPILGTGVGSFAIVEPFYKSSDASSTSALSSLLQWWAESGLIGLSLLLIGGAWCLFRIPGAVRRVGTADRSLVFGLIGTAASFSLYSALHWTVELAAVAVAASAWGGTWNRWLVGGTDLFVERG
jgi:O-antigen ligase